MEKLISVEAAGEQLGVCRNTAYDLVQRGVIPVVNLAPKGARRPSYRVSPVALQRRMEELSRLPEEAA